MRDALQFLICLFFAFPLCAQTLTVTGHLAPFNAKLTICECVSGTTGTVTIDLRHYFTTTIGTIFKREAIYPVGIAPPTSGFMPAEFTTNKITLTIGKDTWTTRYTDPRDEHIDLVTYSTEPNTFQSLSGDFYLFKEGADESMAMLHLDLRSTNTSSLWNVTGAPLASPQPGNFNRFALFKPYGERVVFTADTITGNPAAVEPSPNSLRQGAGNTARNTRTPAGNSNAPPTSGYEGNAPPPSGVGAKSSIPPVPARCLASLDRNTKIMRSLLALETQNPILAEIELDKREVVLTGTLLDTAAECLGPAIVNAMASKADGSSEGTRTSSQTLGTFPGQGGRGPIRVDVENPGGRDAQIQIQRGSGFGKDTRIYDPETGAITDGVRNNPSSANRISNAELKELLNDPKFQRVISTAKRYLGKS